MEPIVYCADAIACLGDPDGPVVLVERLGAVPGLSLPGGKQEPNELLSATVRREFREETGLGLLVTGVLATRAEHGRDPRGHYVSTVFTGIASGLIRREQHKTRVLLLPKSAIPDLRQHFVFDHYDLLARHFGFR